MAAACAVVAGCGGQSAAGPSAIPRALELESRPIGHGARFHPGVRGPVIGACRARLGPRYGVHVELFAANRVELIAAGIGVRAPVRFFEGRIAAARCFGDLVTLEPTGVVLVRPGARLTVGDLFRSWGQPLTGRAYVAGRPWRGEGGAIPLTRHAEIVLEVGPYVPPHATYTFPPGA